MELIEFYVDVMTPAIELALVFNIGNLIIRTILGAAFGGKLRF